MFFDIFADLITKTDYQSIPTITDYSLTYLLNIKFSSQAGTPLYATMPRNSSLTINLPDELIPLIYIAGVPYVRIRSDNITTDLPLTDYSLSGNILRLVIPVDTNLASDFIHVPVKFLIPSDNVSTSLKEINFSKPLVYLQKPTSLICGIKTEGFMLSDDISGFTLKGAQIDTTGLWVYPLTYERGQLVVYTATVYNTSLTSADYYMSMTVPTKKYNPSTTNTNDLTAYIRSINPASLNTVIYYMTEGNATEQDIHVMQTINREGGPTLEEYYNNTIVNNWIIYDPSQPLPDDAVMLAAFTPDIAPNNFVRIDYGVIIELPAGDDTIYTNDAVFNYSSSGLTLESQSNNVSVTNNDLAPVNIDKTPPLQTHPLVNGTEVDFDSYFRFPLDYSLYETFSMSDILPAGIALDEDRCSAILYSGEDVPYELEYDTASNTVVFHVTNTAETAGKLLIIHIAASVSDTTLIPMVDEFGAPGFRNKTTLVVNNDPDLVSDSSMVNVIFTIPAPVPITIQKMPLNQRRQRAAGTSTNFSLVFTAPAETRIYKNFTITDTLPAALEAVASGVTVTAAPDTVVPFDYDYNPLTKTVQVSFTNNALTAGKVITVNLPTMLTSPGLLPPSNTVENMYTVVFNDIPSITSESNTVEVIYTSGGVVGGQEIIDIIESVAMEQTALAHILNAEGEKIQLAVQIAQTTDELLSINRSVESMISAIGRLENVLQQKLLIFESRLCDDDC